MPPVSAEAGIPAGDAFCATADTTVFALETAALTMGPAGIMPPTRPAPERTTSFAARASTAPNSFCGV